MWAAVVEVVLALSLLFQLAPLVVLLNFAHDNEDLETREPVVRWKKCMVMILNQEGSGHSISADAIPVRAISCSDNTYLVRTYSEPLVVAHFRALGCCFDACREAPFESRMFACKSVPQLWALSGSCLLAMPTRTFCDVSLKSFPWCPLPTPSTLSLRFSPQR